MPDSCPNFKAIRHGGRTLRLSALLGGSIVILFGAIYSVGIQYGKETVRENLSSQHDNEERYGINDEGEDCQANCQHRKLNDEGEQCANTRNDREEQTQRELESCCCHPTDRPTASVAVAEANRLGRGTGLQDKGGDPPGFAI